MRRTSHSSSHHHPRLGMGSRRRKKATSRTSRVLARTNEWSLSRRMGKKARGEKKNRDAFSPSRSKSRSFATRRPKPASARVLPLYFVGGNSRSGTIIVPLRRRRRGGTVPLSFSVTVRNYKGESAFKDYEEDLSSSINKHNCPRSWRGRNSSWINLRATAISSAAPAALIRRLQSFPSHRECRLSPPRRSLSLEGPPCRGRAIWRLSALCWFYFPSFANSGISAEVIVRGIIICRDAACCSAAWNIGPSNRPGAEAKRISRQLAAVPRALSPHHLHSHRRHRHRRPRRCHHRLRLSRCPTVSTIPSYDFLTVSPFRLNYGAKSYL